MKPRRLAAVLALLGLVLAILAILRAQERARTPAASTTEPAAAAVARPASMSSERAAVPLPAQPGREPARWSSSDEAVCRSEQDAAMGRADPSPEVQQASRSLYASLRRGDEWAQAVAGLLETIPERALMDPGPAWTAAAHALARRAARTQDPRLYRLAFQACTALARPREGHCAQVSARQWARLEPDNAVPWMFLAFQAEHMEDDAAAEAEALHRIGRATTVDAGFDDIRRAVQAHGDRQSAAGLSAAMNVSRRVAQAESWSSTRRAFVPGRCSEPHVRDANRHQQCDRVARMLLRHGRSQPDRHLAMHLGRSLGWPAAEVEALQLEMVRLAMGAQAFQRGLPASPCERTRATLAFTDETLRDGVTAAFSRRASAASAAAFLAAANASAASAAAADAASAAAEASAPR